VGFSDPNKGLAASGTRKFKKGGGEGESIKSASLTVLWAGEITTGRRIRAIALVVKSVSTQLAYIIRDGKKDDHNVIKAENKEN